MQRCFVVEQKNDSDLLFENYFIIWLYAETKDFRNEFRASSSNGAVRQAFCKPYGFVPPCSVGALVTLHHVGTVHHHMTLLFSFLFFLFQYNYMH